MARYSYGENGEIIMHSRYSRRGAYDLTYIFPNDKYVTGKLPVNMTKCNIEKVYNVEDKSHLTRKIFCVFLMKVLTKVSEGDVYQLPEKTGAHINLKSIPAEKAKRARQMGAFKEIDIVQARIKIPYFAFDFGSKSSRRDRQVYVPQRLTLQAFRNAEEGTLPWTVIRKVKRYDTKNSGFY